METFQDTLEYLYGLEHFGISLGLENIEELCAAVGNPQDALPLIHIAGSNGKGSTLAFLKSLLQAHGFSVGVYTSPHLKNFSERIVIDQTPITEAEIVGLTRRLRPLAERIPRVVTFFDFTTCMALLHFAERRPDFVLLETGLGGRLDATNVARRPLLTIITNIALEHEEFLGSTRLKVAAEKAGILKPGVKLIAGVRDQSVRTFLERRQQELGAEAAFLGRDFRVRRRPDGSFSFHDGRPGADCGRPGPAQGSVLVFRDLRLGMSGRHQQENAALALKVLLELGQSQGFSPEAEKISRALAQTRWPGRLQQVAAAPDIYLDGAHNLHGVQALLPELRRLKGGRRLLLLLGVLKDKRVAEMTALLAPLADEVIVTRAALDRACDPEALAAEARRYCSRVEVTPSVAAAFARARSRARPEDLILLTGSLYCVGEAFSALELEV